MAMVVENNMKGHCTQLGRSAWLFIIYEAEDGGNHPLSFIPFYRN